VPPDTSGDPGSHEEIQLSEDTAQAQGDRA
jgi:hypothetical protein